jgi:ubiquinone biosynthesis protein Coq4
MKKVLVKLRMGMLVFLTHRIALPMLRRLRKPNAFTYSMDDLKSFASGTLGNDLYHFLRSRNLPLLKHYARHDLKHVLLGYDSTEEGEACLQSFMLGNGRVSFPVLATVSFSLLTMPVHWSKMKKAFLAGRKCNPVHNWRWNEVVDCLTGELRNRMRK